MRILQQGRPRGRAFAVGLTREVAHCHAPEDGSTSQHDHYVGHLLIIEGELTLLEEGGQPEEELEDCHFGAEEG
jgi:hypothetical protein